MRMSDLKTLEPIRESSKESRGSRASEMSDTEMVFGDDSQKSSGHDAHLIVNERKHGTDHNDNDHPMQRLLEPDKGKQKPPLAGPEIDDIDEGPEVTTGNRSPYPGIDDGLLEPADKTNKHSGGDDREDDEKKDSLPHEGNGSAEDGHDDDDAHLGSHPSSFGDSVMDPLLEYTHEPRSPLPLDVNGFGSRFPYDPERPGSPIIPGSIPDVNTYQQKKNLAQGMMDLALLSANANQLRYVLESSTKHPYYYPSLIFISLSIILQVAVGVGLIMNSRYNVKDDKDICKADKINNMTVLGVFLITIVNVFITSFSVAVISPTDNNTINP